MGTFLKIIGISSLVFVAICIVESVTLSIVSENTPLGFDYSTEIVVDKSEKIPAAISNAIAKVVSKDFDLVYLCVRCTEIPALRYRVEARGIERGNLLAY